MLVCDGLGFALRLLTQPKPVREIHLLKHTVVQWTAVCSLFTHEVLELAELPIKVSCGARLR